MKSQKINTISPALQLYRPGEVFRESQKKNKKNNKIILINEKINRSLMNININTERGQMLNNSNQNIENKQNVKNLTTSLADLSIDQIFNSLILHKNNLPLEKRIINKNISSLENFANMADIIITVSDINPKYEIGIIKKHTIIKLK